MANPTPTREQVEATLARAERFDTVRPEELAALCRSWLALEAENRRLVLAGSAAARLAAKVMVRHLALPDEELFSLATEVANALLHAKSPESFGPSGTGRVQPGAGGEGQKA